jgi:uncharacterized protein YjiS (DUF1127 family)
VSLYVVLAVVCAALWIVQRRSVNRLTRVTHHRLREVPEAPGSADSTA